MKTIDNLNNRLVDDLREQLTPRCRVSIAASTFSIYTYEKLKKQLNEVESFRFIFTTPTLVSEKQKQERREFYIPTINSTKSLCSSEFELKLRNELTQKAVAKECVEWIRRKATFKSNISNMGMSGFINIEQAEHSISYYPIQGFTTMDLGYGRGDQSYNYVLRLPSPMNQNHINLFPNLWSDTTQLNDVTEQLIERISASYQENAPERLYALTLHQLFSEFLEEISEDNLPNEATGFKSSEVWNKLYDFQRDGALAIINKLEKFNGCILADSVGLGKTFTALAVIKYYENRNKSVLVLCPKKLNDNWMDYRSNVTNNPIVKDRLRYDVLFHTDLSREGGKTNGIPLDKVNWGNYDLVVIDESHNFRNGGESDSEEEDKKRNRYQHLLDKVIRAGVKTKVLMLSATPVNNRFLDLKNQLALAYEGDSAKLEALLKSDRSIDSIFKSAQSAFNHWSKLEPQERTTTRLMENLEFDFFELLDSVTIARSRRHIERYYSNSAVGRFPTRRAPISHHPALTLNRETIKYSEIYESLEQLSLAIYTPTAFLHPSRVSYYEDLYGRNMGNTFFKQSDREEGIRRLISINLLKRLESSVHSFRLTVQKIKQAIDYTLALIDQKQSNGSFEEDLDSAAEFVDADDQNSDLFVGKKVKIALSDMDYVSWKRYLEADSHLLGDLDRAIATITVSEDNKLQTLLRAIDEKITHPINEGNKKVLIFTAFSDTAEYLYKQVSRHVQTKHGLHSALITGSVNRCTISTIIKGDMNRILTHFSPRSKQLSLLKDGSKERIDILIATDCISEGQNLQDCDYLANYDIHWNPVRLIQRFGRIDRIGSINEEIQMVNFWPDLDLDLYINLKGRVETRMKITIMSSTGDDNLISVEEKGDLDYRKQQLTRLQSEVVDIEEMGSGVSIMDIGLNEFRQDLLAYISSHSDLDQLPFGMHALLQQREEGKEGVVFVLKNLNNSVDGSSQNRLHPFYMVYISSEGVVLCNHLQPKQLLDQLRLHCKGESQPNQELCAQFNRETKEGRDMEHYSELLQKAITSMIQVKERVDVNQFLIGGSIDFGSNEFKGLDDFELISFFVIR